MQKKVAEAVALQKKMKEFEKQRLADLAEEQEEQEKTSFKSLSDDQIDSSETK